MQLINTKFSIWDEGGNQLFETFDYTELMKSVRLIEEGVLQLPGAKLILGGIEKEIIDTTFNLSRYSDSQIQIVVTVKND
jgi:hypothetical protein